MLEVLFFVAIFILSVDVFIAGSVAGFLQRTTDFKLIFRLQVFLAFCTSAFFLLGLVVGKLGGTYFSQWSVWYASTIIFLLALKMLYDGLRMHKIRKSINPIDKSGLVALTAMVSINTFFTGIGFGLLNLNYNYFWFVIILFVLVVTLGYFSGFKLKKLIGLRVELFAALLFFIIAVVITLKL